MWVLKASEIDFNSYNEVPRNDDIIICKIHCIVYIIAKEMCPFLNGYTFQNYCMKCILWACHIVEPLTPDIVSAGIIQMFA